MTKKNDNTVWITEKYSTDSVGYTSVEDAIQRLQMVLAEATEAGWEDLNLDYDSYGDSLSLYIFGKRPESEKEKTKRLELIRDTENRERLQYEALKKKFLEK